MVETIFDWLQNGLVFVALTLVCFSFVETLLGGALIVIPLTLLSLVFPAIGRVIQADGGLTMMRLSKYAGVLTPVAFLIWLVWAWQEGMINAGSIESVIKNPALVLFCATGATLVATNASATGAAMREQAKGYTVQSLLVLPCYIVVFLYSFEARPLTVIAAFVTGIGIALLSIAIGVLILQNKKMREQQLAQRNAQAEAKLEQVEKWHGITAFIPRFAAMRRELSYLRTILEDAYENLRIGRSHEAAQRYEVFDFEYVRITQRLDREIAQNLRAELVDQLGIQKSRATSIREKLQGGPLSDVLQQVETELDQYLVEFTQKNDWSMDGDLQRRFSELEAFLTRLDRLEALSDTESGQKSLELHFRGLVSAEELVRVSAELGWNATNIETLSKQLRALIDKIAKRNVSSSRELMDLGEAADRSYEQLIVASREFRERLARGYEAVRLDRGAYALCPRAVKSKDESRVMIVRRSEDTTLKTAHVKIWAAGAEFGRGTFDLAPPTGIVDVTVCRFVARGIRRTTLEITVQQGDLQSRAEAKIDVDPTTFELIQEGGAVSTIVGILVGVILWFLGQDTAIASVVGGASALLFLAIRVFVRRRSIRKSIGSIAEDYDGSAAVPEPA